MILNHEAVAPTVWKRGLIKCFLHRADLICSDEDALTEEIDKLRGIFHKNGYPVKVFDREMKEYVERKTRIAEEVNSGKSEESDENDDKPLRAWVRVPFIGKPSILFSRRLSRLIKDRMGTEVRTVFETTKVKDSFVLKDITPKDISAKVVYMFSCRGDPTTNYIGYSKRSLRERVNEHLRPGTAVSDHIAHCAKCNSVRINIDDFQIMRKCRTKTDAQVYEAMLIKRLNPKLNRQFVKPGQSFTLRVFN